jgi:hypothetical protein
MDCGGTLSVNAWAVPASAAAATNSRIGKAIGFRILDILMFENR